MTTTAFQFDEKAIAAIQSVFHSRFKFRMMLLTRLPMGFLSGMRIHHMDRDRCEVDIRYKWLNKNPFKSTFWAVLGMAAEMSSGAMILLYTHGQKPSIATLVTATEARYYKKAVGRTRFICESGPDIAAAAARTATTGEGIEVRCAMKGFNDQGELVAEFVFTWSLKARLKP